MTFGCRCAVKQTLTSSILHSFFSYMRFLFTVGFPICFPPNGEFWPYVASKVDVFQLGRLRSVRDVSAHNLEYCTSPCVAAFWRYCTFSAPLGSRVLTTKFGGLVRSPMSSSTLNGIFILLIVSDSRGSYSSPTARCNKDLFEKWICNFGLLFYSI